MSSSSSADGYTLEWAIPHASLDRIRGGPWETLRVNLAVGDVDALTGSKVLLWWKPRWETMESHPASGVFRRSGAEVAEARRICLTEEWFHLF